MSTMLERSMEPCWNCKGEAYLEYFPGHGTSDPGQMHGGCKKCRITIKADMTYHSSSSYVAAKSVVDIWNAHRFTIAPAETPEDIEDSKLADETT